MMKNEKKIVEIYINNAKILARSNISILEASTLAGFKISRFCYHESLSVAGSCRICLVEVEKSLRPAASCALPIMSNMRIFIDTPLVKKARENVIETLLINHPLDCPICDQAGECDLQDLTEKFGGVNSRMFNFKRVIEDKECGAMIQTIMTRCIHCTRCIRFVAEITGNSNLGTFSRGKSTEIGGYTSLVFKSELSGNVIDLCPVGALTSKVYAFKARPWDLISYNSLDLNDSTGSNTQVYIKEVELLRILPRKNKEINGNLISDKARFSFDANKQHRIQTPLLRKIIKKGKEEEIKFDNWTWEKFTNDIDVILKETSKKILLIISDELDLEAMSTAKKLTYRTKGQIRVKTLNFSSSESTFFEKCPVNKISDMTESKSTYSFLISCNLKIESSILNGKLRSKYLKDKLGICSLGHSFISNIKMKFACIGSSNVVNFLEGKSEYSIKFVETKSPLVFIGESFRKRFDPMSYFVAFLKKIAPSALIFTIDSYCNSKGASLMNIESVNDMDVETSDILVFLNLDDNTAVREIIERKAEKSIYWLNTHNSQIIYESNFVLPTRSFLETEGIYLNLEGRPQKTFKTSAMISQTSEGRSVNSIFKSILGDFLPSPFLNYVFEMIRYPQKFTLLKDKFYNVKSKEIVNPVVKVSTYPLISSIEDFYTKGSFVKNSLIMTKCSQESRKEPRNF